MNIRSERASRRPTQYVEVAADGSDMWRAEAAIEALKAGGCGVLPTDTSYSFVTLLSSKEGTKRILALKGAGGEKKPLSLLCRNFGDIELYTKGMSKQGFKFLRKNLPGPFTFILPASGNLPKGLYKDGERRWKRDSVGVRIPNDAVCAAVLAELNEPLLCSSVPMYGDGGDGGDGGQYRPLDGGSASWCEQIDFILDAGERPSDGSTIYDLTGDEIELLRDGLGSLDED